MSLPAIDPDDPLFHGDRTVALQGRRLPIPRELWPAVPSWSLCVRLSGDIARLHAADAARPGFAAEPDGWLPLDDLGRVRLPARLWHALGAPTRLRLTGHGRELEIAPPEPPARPARPARRIGALRPAGAAVLPALHER
jgi:hypothetical protein